MLQPKFTEYQHQLLAAATANLCTAGVGAMLGWLSAYLVLLSSEQTPLDAPLTATQSGCIAAMVSVTAIVSNMLTVVLLPALGARFVVLLTAAPLAVSNKLMGG